jgi:hypothetical protein
MNLLCISCQLKGFAVVDYIVRFESNNNIKIKTWVFPTYSSEKMSKTVYVPNFLFVLFYTVRNIAKLGFDQFAYPVRYI